jgi:pimeloyl-ACP methyl ester carboxylesterase
MDFSDFQQMTFLNLDCEIHYWYKKGMEDKYIILLHGAGCDHLMFEKQISIFGDEYNVIAWDARGHGLSILDKDKKFSFKDMYADCLKLLEIHNIRKVILIGQSMGGNLAQEIAYYHPELISRLILIDCTRNTQRLTATEKFILKISSAILKVYPWKIYICQSVNVCGKMEYTKNYVNRCFERMDKRNFIEIITSVFTCLHEDKEFRFKQPVLLICGKDDISGNIRKTMKTWTGSDDNCKLCMIENAGHNSNQDNPDEVNRNILLFLK